MSVVIKGRERLLLPSCLLSVHSEAQHFHNHASVILDYDCNGNILMKLS
jgi:hypothetical protein